MVRNTSKTTGKASLRSTSAKNFFSAASVQMPPHAASAMRRSSCSTTGCRNSNARLLTTSSAKSETLEMLLIVTKRFCSASFEWLVLLMQFSTCLTPSTPESAKLQMPGVRYHNELHTLTSGTCFMHLLQNSRTFVPFRITRDAINVHGVRGFAVHTMRSDLMNCLSDNSIW